MYDTFSGTAQLTSRPTLLFIKSRHGLHVIVVCEHKCCQVSLCNSNHLLSDLCTCYGAPSESCFNPPCVYVVNSGPGKH